MKETSCIAKTDRQLLLEERAGKDLRAVLIEAYAATDGSMREAARWIGTRYGVKISASRFHGWAKQVGLRRGLTPAEFPQ